MGCACLQRRRPGRALLRLRRADPERRPHRRPRGRSAPPPTLLGARSAIVVPLRNEQHGVQAVVAIWSTRPRAFNDLHVHTIRLVAGLLSAALERAAAFASNQVLLAERTASLAAIQAAEERFRTLVESIDDVVFRLDRDQRCVDIFGRWLAARRLPAGRLPRPHHAPRSSGPTRARCTCGPTSGRWPARPSPTSGPGPRAAAPGTCRPRSRRSAGPTATWPGIVGVGRDITQRIEAEQQVRQAQKMEAVGRFAGGVAHDLNNMMMIIIGFSDFLLGDARAGRRRRGDADEIRKAAERAMHLTRQLLGFGRQPGRRPRGAEPERGGRGDGAHAAPAAGRGHHAGHRASSPASAASRRTTARWSRWS